MQPNTFRAQSFAEAFLSCGGIESLLALLQREAKAGDHDDLDYPSDQDDNTVSAQETEPDSPGRVLEGTQADETVGTKEGEKSLHERAPEPGSFSSTGLNASARSNIGKKQSLPENAFMKNLGGISFSISAENARNNVYNIDRRDGIIFGIINLLGTLVSSGYLKFGTQSHPDVTNNTPALFEAGGTMFDDKVSLLLFALQKAFQAAPNRLMSRSVYIALLGASVCTVYLFILYFFTSYALALCKYNPSLFFSSGTLDSFISISRSANLCNVYWGRV